MSGYGVPNQLFLSSEVTGPDLRFVGQCAGRKKFTVVRLVTASDLLRLCVVPCHLVSKVVVAGFLCAMGFNVYGIFSIAFIYLACDEKSVVRMKLAAHYHAISSSSIRGTAGGPLVLRCLEPQLRPTIDFCFLPNRS